MRVAALAVAASAAIGMFFATSVQAAPMSFKDSVTVMGDFGPNTKELAANYALTARDALGAGLVYMRSDDYGRDRTAVEAIYTRLIKRWNMPDAQANFWFIGGIGSVRGNDFSGDRAVATPGFEADYETTRIYVVAQYRMFRAKQLQHDTAMARVGFSFYEVDYDQLQPWFVLEARRTKGLSDKIEVTPMLRLVQNRFVIELGVNTSRQWRANFLYTF